MPYHVDFDKYEEERLGKQSFGSTKSGIAPFYSDKLPRWASRCASSMTRRCSVSG